MVFFTNIVVRGVYDFGGGVVLGNVDEHLLESIDLLLTDLVGIKSDTGTELEINVENFMHNWLKELQYFREKPEYLGCYKLPQDPLKRGAIWALRKGEGKKTIILLNHHDVVNADDYGLLSSYAYNPEILMTRLKKIKLPQEARDDLGSGKWIFGRGTADMKAGIAIQLALLEQYSKVAHFKGNILLLSVPDEESLSRGMIASLSLLNDLKEKHSLNYELVINCEPHERSEEGAGTIHGGSVGKMMPVIYVRGKQSHIGNVFQGFNPISLLSKIADEVELNPDFSDEAHNEVSPPPSFVCFRDLKKTYDVSIPNAAVGYFSILTLKSTPEEITDRLKDISIKASEETIYKIGKKHKDYIDKLGSSEKVARWDVKITTFAELYEEAQGTSGELFALDYNKTVEKIKKEIENKLIGLADATTILIEKTLAYIDDMDPRVIIGFIPPYYLHVSNRDFHHLSSSIEGLSDEINRFTLNKWNEMYRSQNYFMGISDMSYFYMNERTDVVTSLGPNMPLWNKIYHIPFGEIEKLSIPVINIGPWGKDIHKFTERVYKRDLLERTPSIIKHVMEHLLDEK